MLELVIVIAGGVGVVVGIVVVVARLGENIFFKNIFFKNILKIYCNILIYLLLLAKTYINIFIIICKDP